jgi:hypothetical protein
MPIITQVPVAITLYSSVQVSALPLLDKVQQLRHGPNDGQQPVMWHCGSVSHRLWAAGCSADCLAAPEFNNFSEQSWREVIPSCCHASSSSSSSSTSCLTLHTHWHRLLFPPLKQFSYIFTRLLAHVWILMLDWTSLNTRNQISWYLLNSEALREGKTQTPPSVASHPNLHTKRSSI